VLLHGLVLHSPMAIILSLVQPPHQVNTIMCSVLHSCLLFCGAWRLIKRDIKYLTSSAHTHGAHTRCWLVLGWVTVTEFKMGAANCIYRRCTWRRSSEYLASRLINKSFGNYWYQQTHDIQLWFHKYISFIMKTIQSTAQLGIALNSVST